MTELENQSNEHFKQLAKVGLLTREIVGPYTKALLVETMNGVYAVHPEDLGVGGELRKLGQYGLLQIEHIKKLLDEDNTILVVGAHIGSIAIPLAKHCASIVAIEANPFTFDLLKLNIGLNKISNCEIFNIAASEKNEDITFLLNTVNSGGSKRKPLIDHYWYSYDHPKEISIPAVPLDDYLIGKNFDIIVMDIEGSEYFALKGMKDILSKARALIVEFLPHHLKNVSGISVEQFLSILPPFQLLTIPSMNLKVNQKQFQPVLKHMYDNNLGDDGIIFEKI